MSSEPKVEITKENINLLTSETKTKTAHGLTAGAGSGYNKGRKVGKPAGGL